MPTKPLSTETFAEAIRDALEIEEQKQLAERAGVQPTTIQRVKDGRRWLDGPRFDRLCAALGLKVSWRRRRKHAPRADRRET
jgi:transcriptional regulator with XRE-family HTH domain